jgi:hypothetical protein
VELMPADRLPQVASRILAAQPEPPRRVSMVDIWTINWPLLVYIVVPGVIVNVVLSFVPRLPLAIRILAILLPLTSLGIWFALVILPQVVALQRGAPDVGTVVEVMLQPRGGYRGRVRLERVQGSEPSTFYYLTTHTVAVGDRLRVLVDPSNGKVLTTLGHAG